MDFIKITAPEVLETASLIRTYNSNLDDTLAYVSRTMNEINNVWDSESERTLLARFQKFAGRFINESEVIENYAKFLDETVSKYESLENVFVANASNFE